MDHSSYPIAIKGEVAEGQPAFCNDATEALM